MTKHKDDDELKWWNWCKWQHCYKTKFVIICYNKPKDHTIENKHNDKTKWNEDGQKRWKKETIAIELSKTLLQRCNNRSFKCARTLL